jgi:hypothetical protein
LFERLALARDDNQRSTEIVEAMQDWTSRALQHLEGQESELTDRRRRHQSKGRIGAGHDTCHEAGVTVLPEERLHVQEELASLRTATDEEI